MSTENHIPKSYDLDAIISAEVAKPVTFKVGVIFDADGEPVSGFHIVGRNSDLYRAADKALRIVNQKAAANRTKAIDQKTDAGAEKVISVIEDQNVARAAAVVVGWFGWDKNGVEREFDASVVLSILAQMPTWVEKIQYALFEDSNFLPVSQTTSAPTPNSN